LPTTGVVIPITYAPVSHCVFVLPSSKGVIIDSLKVPSTVPSSVIVTIPSSVYPTTILFIPTTMPSTIPSSIPTSQIPSSWISPSSIPVTTIPNIPSTVKSRCLHVYSHYLTPSAPSSAWLA